MWYRQRSAAVNLMSNPFPRRSRSNKSGESGIRRVGARSIAADRVVVALSEIAVGVLNVVELSELRKLAVISNGEEMLAYDMQCPHMGGDLSNGEFAHGEIRCPWHGYRFSTATGRFVDNPNIEATRLARVKTPHFDPDQRPSCRLRAYEARVAGDEVHIHLPLQPS